MKCQFVAITFACILLGCDRSTPVPATARPLVRDSVREPQNSCLLNLKDGTSLELFRSPSQDGGPSQITITAKHRINLHHLTGEVLDSRQAPMRALSYALGPTPESASSWAPFPRPNERGEMSFYMFYYSADVVTETLEMPVQFKIVGRDETYILSIPSLSEFADSPAAYDKFSSH